MKTLYGQDKQQKLGIILGCLVFFLDASCFSQTASFFPTEALQKRSSVLAIGVIIGCFDVAGIFACLSPIFLTMDNTKAWFFAGAAFSGLSNVCFGFTYYINDVISFCVVSALVQSLMGTGCFLIWVCGLPYLVSIDPSQAAIISGLTQVMDGLGAIFGPPVGSFIFSKQGFLGPFLVNGSLLFITAIAGYVTLKSPEIGENTEVSILKLSYQSGCEIPDLEQKETASLGKPRQETARDGKQSFGKFIKNPKILLCAMPFSLASIYYGYTFVSLAPYLQKSFKITGDTVGYYFLINSFTSAVMSGLTGKLTDCGYGVILYSLVPILVSVSFFAIFLPLKIPSLLTLKLFVPFIAISGGFYSIASVSFFLVCEKAALAENFVDLSAIRGYVATLWGLAFCCGRLIGSFVIGGAILSTVGFYWTNFIIATVAFLSAIPTFVLLMKLNLLKKVFYSDQEY